MDDFQDNDECMSFVDWFLDFNSESCIQSLKLRYDATAFERDTAHVTSWINNVVKRKIQHLNVHDYTWGEDKIEIPSTVYNSQNLVSLKLYNVKLADTKFVSLPSLRVMDINIVKLANGLAFERLISGCPVLESLTIRRKSKDIVDVLRVCSKSLLSFTHVYDGFTVVDQEVVIDAPKLKYLRLDDLRTVRFIRNNPPSIVKVDISIMFKCFQKGIDPNDLHKRQIIRNFLDGISGVQDMILWSRALERFISFVLWGHNPVSRPHCFISSLEFVELENPIVGDPSEMKLVSYFLENSTNLKKLTLRLDCRHRGESAILEELNAIPRLSSTCEVVVVG